GAILADLGVIARGLETQLLTPLAGQAEQEPIPGDRLEIGFLRVALAPDRLPGPFRFQPPTGPGALPISTLTRPNLSGSGISVEFVRRRCLSSGATGLPNASPVPDWVDRRELRDYDLDVDRRRLRSSPSPFPFSPGKRPEGGRRCEHSSA